MIFNNMLQDEENVTAQDEQDAFSCLFHTTQDLEHTIKQILQNSYNNKQFPDTRCAFYNSQTNTFYGVFKNENYKNELRVIDYIKDLQPDISQTLENYFNKMKMHIPPCITTTDLEDKSQNMYFIKLKNIEHYKIRTDDTHEIKKYTQDVLEFAIV